MTATFAHRRVKAHAIRLGHASIQITYDIYGGLLNLRDRTVARAMATAMAGLKSIADAGELR